MITNASLVRFPVSSHIPLFRLEHNNDDINTSWHLKDSPAEIRFWIIVPIKFKATAYFGYEDGYKYRSDLQLRPDVRSVYSVTYPPEQYSFLGLRSQVLNISQLKEVGILLEDESEKIEFKIACLQIDYSLQPLEGKNGYLFLDNDTNKSVDQFTGTALLEDLHLTKWLNFLAQVEDLSKDCDFQWNLMIAPSKEYVCEHLYPYSKSCITPLEQLEQKIQDIYKISYVDCLSSLSRDWNLSYSMLDTHWSDYGAYIAAKLLGQKNGISESNLDYILEAIPFNMSKVPGDLGVKMLPKKYNHIPKADFTSMAANRIFDNFIHNHGRIWIYENSEALEIKTMIVFGDSFSTNLVTWLSLLYFRIVYVHSAASIDQRLIHIENPDFILLQTNSRFLGSVPSIETSIKLKIQDKLNAMSELKSSHLISLARDGSNNDIVNRDYWSMMITE